MTHVYIYMSFNHWATWGKNMQTHQQAGCDSERAVWGDSDSWERERMSTQSTLPKWDYIAVVFNANKDKVSK